MITCNGFPVIEGTLAQPYQGAWTADLSVATDGLVSGRVLIEDGDIGRWVGTVVTGGRFSTRADISVVGGSGGLSQRLQVRHYNGASLGRILGEICTDAGESKSPTLSPQISFQRPSRWSRAMGTGGEALAELAADQDLAWRVLSSGNVWLGEGSTSQRAPYQVEPLNGDPKESSYMVAPNGLWLQVGMSQSYGQVRRVEYTWDDASPLRAKVRV